MRKASIWLPLLPKHILPPLPLISIPTAEEQQIQRGWVLAVQASGGWIIRAFGRRGREGKVRETGDHTGRQRTEPRSHLPPLYMPLQKLTDTPLARPRPVR